MVRTHVYRQCTFSQESVEDTFVLVLRGGCMCVYVGIRRFDLQPSRNRLDCTWSVDGPTASGVTQQHQSVVNTWSFPHGSFTKSLNGCSFESIDVRSSAFDKGNIKPNPNPSRHYHTCTCVCNVVHLIQEETRRGFSSRYICALQIRVQVQLLSKQR